MSSQQKLQFDSPNLKGFSQTCFRMKQSRQTEYVMNGKFKNIFLDRKSSILKSP